MNVIEIDAASNNGVDNIREIREEVAYRPTEGRYKVYIIDEVHMLSIGAFNALLKTLEEHPPRHRPTVSVLINCGFLEPGQNDVAVQMVELFCGQNGYPFGSVLKIGGGEAILDTPFRGLVRRKLRKLAGAISAGRHRSLQVTMPLPKRLFLRASTAYWTDMGGRGGVTREQMATMEIEGR